MSYGPSVTVKKPNASKSLCKISKTLNVKPNNSVRRLCADKSKRKAIRAGSMMCYIIPKRRGHKKINEFFEIDL